MLCVATAASAAAATWPSASAAPSSAMRQSAALDAASGNAAGHSASQTVAPATATVAFQQVRSVLGTRVAAIEAARARAAVARAHAAHLAHEQHVRAVAQAAAAARAAARQAAAQRAAQQQAQTQQPVQQASAPSGSPQQIAEAMLGQFGWSGQFSCLDPLWEHESGWNPSAENPGSGAYGIPQALPGSKMASAGPDWATNPATQIRWGLDYIRSTYGSPCAAWSHEEATGWY